MHALAPSVPSDVPALLAALAPQVPEAPAGAALAGLDAPGGTVAGVLGEALSLTQSVRLDDYLSRPPPAGGTEGSSQLHAALTQRSTRQLVALRERIDTMYAGAYDGPEALADASGLLATLAELTAADAGARGRKRTSAALAKPYGLLLSRTLSGLHRPLDLLEQHIRHALRGLGPAAEHLLGLHGLVHPVVTAQLREGHAAIVSTYVQRCASQLDLVLAVQLKQPDGAALQASFAPRGSLWRLWDVGRRLSHVLLDLEWSALQGWIDATCSGRDRNLG